MRPSTTLRATVKSASQYLERGAPTGLTGLITHPAPRAALLGTYQLTLHRLRQLPTSSVYRQSCEALTKQRLKVIEATVPEGYDAWLERVKKTISAHQSTYSKYLKDNTIDYAALKEHDAIPKDLGAMGNQPWDGKLTRRRSEGSNTFEQAQAKADAAQRDLEGMEQVDKEGEVVDLETEPALTREQYDAHS
jgi:NADH dehydrogenase (ubiquinone) 1 alpha subcomplex subunit 5